FGYAPILPLVVQEKGDRLHSTTVRGIGSMAAAVARLAAADEQRPVGVDNGESSYVDAIRNAVRAALAGGAAVVLVAPPGPTAADAADREALAAMASSVFAGEPRVRFVAAGTPEDVADPARWLNGVALSAGGHSVIAEHVA